MFIADIDHSFLFQDQTVRNAVFSKDTWQQLQQGLVPVPQELINAYLAEQIKTNDKVTACEITIKPNNIIEIHAITSEYGKIYIKAQIESMIHNKDQSILTFQVLERRLEDRPLLNLFFGWMTLSFFSKFIGDTPFGEGILVDIGEHGKVTVDFHEFLYHSSAGNIGLYKYKLLDIIEIKAIKTQDKYLDLVTNINLSNDLQNLISTYLSLHE